MCYHSMMQIAEQSKVASSREVKVSWRDKMRHHFNPLHLLKWGFGISVLRWYEENIYKAILG
jgi:hypothetical protein